MTVKGYLRKFGATYRPVQCLHQCKVHMKRSYGEGEPKYVNPQSVQKAYRPGRDCKLLRLLQCRIGPSMVICAMFAPKQCLYQKQAMGKESLKM